MLTQIALNIKEWFSIKRLIGIIILTILACALFGIMIATYGVPTVAIVTLICLVAAGLVYLGIILIV